MEIIRGKQSYELNSQDFFQLIADYTEINIDLGTGDGRFVSYMAGRNPHQYFVGVDACRDNLAALSRKPMANALFVAANVLDLPGELRGIASCLTINFPWGSLLKGLVQGEEVLLDRLAALARPGTALAVSINGGALAEVGCTFTGGTDQLSRALGTCGFAMKNSRSLDVNELRALPSTWAKRIAFGRDPRACALRGVKV